MTPRKALPAKRQATPHSHTLKAGISTEISTPARFVPSHGIGQLNRGGTLGNKGGTGRPPDEFRARMRELATLADKRKHIETVLDDPAHPQWLPALRHVTEHGYGKAIQPVDLAQTIEVVIRFEDEPGERKP